MALELRYQKGPRVKAGRFDRPSMACLWSRASNHAHAAGRVLTLKKAKKDWLCYTIGLYWSQKLVLWGCWIFLPVPGTLALVFYLVLSIAWGLCLLYQYKAAHRLKTEVLSSQVIDLILTLLLWEGYVPLYFCLEPHVGKWNLQLIHVSKEL